MRDNSKAAKDLYWQELKEGKWENKPSIVINPLKKKQGVFFVLLILGFFLALKLSDGFIEDTVRPAIKSYTNDGLKPEMQKLAAQGKISAILWLAQSYPGEQQTQLDHLVASNNPDALMIKAQQLYPTNRALSLKYMQAAANEGHPDAMKHLLQKKLDNRMDMPTFFKEYVLK